MTITQKGAWFQFYEKGMVGTAGQDLASQSDMLGWACIGWKHQLYFRLGNVTYGMTLDSPQFGAQAADALKRWQEQVGLTADGVLGPKSGERLLGKQIQEIEIAQKTLVGRAYQVIAHESGFDLGAIGAFDTGDRGCAQIHLSPKGPILLSQAVRPVWAITHLANFLTDLHSTTDWDVATVSWNIGSGSALWWFQQGKPKTGSPSWWDVAGDGDMSERAWAYLDAVRSVSVPYS